MCSRQRTGPLGSSLVSVTSKLCEHGCAHATDRVLLERFFGAVYAVRERVSETEVAGAHDLLQVHVRGKPMFDPLRSDSNRVRQRASGVVLDLAHFEVLAHDASQ